MILDLEAIDHIQSLRLSGRTDDAIAELRAAEGIAPSAEMKTTLMLIEVATLSGSGRYSEARSRLKEVSERLSRKDPLWSRAALADANLCVDESKPKKALRIYKRILRLWSNGKIADEDRDIHASALIDLGTLLDELNRSAEALPILRQALVAIGEIEHSPKVDPVFKEPLSWRKDRGRVLYYIGRACAALRKFNEAREVTQQAIAAGLPENTIALAHYQLGSIYQVLGSHARALDEFRLVEGILEGSIIPPKQLYGHLVSVTRSLGLEEEANRYANLAKTK